MRFQEKKDSGRRERRGGRRKVQERERERRWRRKEEKGVEETDREKGIETSSYNRLLGSVMKQLSDKFNFLLLPLFSSCLSHHLSLFHLLLCPLLTLSDLFPFFLLLLLNQIFIHLSPLSSVPFSLSTNTLVPLVLCLFSVPFAVFVSLCPFCL